MSNQTMSQKQNCGAEVFPVKIFRLLTKENGKALNEVTLDEMRKTIPEATPEFPTLFDPVESVRKRRLVGGTGFAPVAQQLEFWQKELKNV